MSSKRTSQQIPENSKTFYQTQITQIKEAITALPDICELTEEIYSQDCWKS